MLLESSWSWVLLLVYICSATNHIQAEYATKAALDTALQPRYNALSNINAEIIALKIQLQPKIEEITGLASEAEDRALSEEETTNLKSYTELYCPHAEKSAQYFEMKSLLTIEKDLAMVPKNWVDSTDQTPAEDIANALNLLLAAYDDDSAALKQDLTAACSSDEARNSLYQKSMGIPRYSALFTASLNNRVFAFSDCGPCRASASQLKEMAEEGKIARNDPAELICEGESNVGISDPSKTNADYSCRSDPTGSNVEDPFASALRGGGSRFRTTSSSNLLTMLCFALCSLLVTRNWINS